MAAHELGHVPNARRPRRAPRRGLAPTVAVGLLVALAGPVLARGVVVAATEASLHARLLRSEPADSSVLDRPPERLRLLFSEPVAVALARVVIVGPGAATMQVSAVADSADARVMLAPLPPLDSGTYRVEWRIASADGHPIQGTFTFRVSWSAPPDSARAGSDAPVRAPESAAASPPGRPAGSAPASGTSTAGGPALAAAARGVAVGVLAAFAGVLAFLAWVARTPSPHLWRLTTWLGAIAGIALAAHALAWMRYVSPTGELTGPVVRSAAASATGMVEVLRVGLTLLALAALALARRARLAAMLALLAVVVSGAVGHPAAIRPALAVPAKAIHLLATALWLGGLLALAAAREDDVADAERVSSVALASVIAIALTGVLQTVLFLDAPADLVRSAYGRLVLVKAAGLSVLVVFGARNRYRLLPALAGGGAAALRRSVRWEAAVMAAAILVAGFLAYVPVPAPRP